MQAPAEVDTMKDTPQAHDQPPDDRDPPQQLLSRFWRTASLFWRSKSRVAAWGLTGGLLLIIVLLVGAAYAMNLWNRAIFDGLQNKDATAVARLSLIYFLLLAISVGFSVAQPISV
jgi:putative ATP-binding cassette transporter